MKFENIKVGDTVYIQKEVRYNLFLRGIYFWIPVKVERVTAKKFIVEGEFYRKEDGRIGNGYFTYAKLLGDETDKRGVRVADQTEEMHAMLRTIRHVDEIKDKVHKLKKVNYKTERLEEIHELLRKVQVILEVQ